MKKKVFIKGKVLSELKLGEPAYILDNGKVLRTSTVVKISGVSFKYIMFETLNTYYYITTSPVMSFMPHRMLSLCA